MVFNGQLVIYICIYTHIYIERDRVIILMPIRNPQLQPPSGDEGGLMEGFQASDADSWQLKMSFGPVG